MKYSKQDLSNNVYLFTQQCIGDTDQLTEVGFEYFYFGWNGMDTMLTVKQYYSFETSNIYLYIVPYCTSSSRRLVCYQYEDH